MEGTHLNMNDSQTVVHVSRVRLGPDNRPDWSDVVGVGMFQIKPGAIFDRHFHDFDEYWLIHQGKAKVKVGDAESYVQRGDMVCTRAGVHHDIIEVYEEVEAFYFEQPVEDGGRLGHLHEPVEDSQGHLVHGMPIPVDFPDEDLSGMFGQ